MCENERRGVVMLGLIGIVDDGAPLLLVRVLMYRCRFHGWRPIRCQY